MSKRLEDILREECPDMPENRKRQILGIYGAAGADESRERREAGREVAREKKEDAAREAQRFLSREKRPVRRADMLSAMDLAISDRVQQWRENPGRRSAVSLLATVICRNILADGPLHENQGGAS